MSCEKEDNDITNVDTNIDIAFIDSEGLDLLDPSNPNAYDKDQIKIYQLKDSKKELFFEGNLDYPNGYFIFKEGDMEFYNIRILATGVLEDSIATIYLELDSNNTDTINSYIEKGNNSYICKKVLYNGLLVWKYENSNPRQFVIEKE